MARLMFCIEGFFDDEALCGWRVNPWDGKSDGEPSSIIGLSMIGCNHSSLMTGRCHWSGSEEEDRRFKWR